ncbi:MAG: ABC transporter ATP-binding protein [Chlamydiota bacterium]|nr:ABC transporter ATP-binding protein [Chlamydiota bacterium]
MTLKIENISKKYVIHHARHLESETLKDKLTDGLSRLFKRNRGAEPYHQIEDFWALNDVSFELNQGDQLAILGKNGAGKSTLLKIISRITPPTKGKVTIDGRVASLLEVGTGFHPELTGKENIYLNGALLGMTKQEIKRNFDEIVCFSEIEQFLDTPVKRYSSGMFVRLAFAVASHLESEILVIDEALAVGDSQFKRKCIEKLEEISRRGRTIIFVSHDMLALKFCNKGILLDQGRIIPTENLNDCISKYSGATSETNNKNIWAGHFESNSVIVHQLEFVRLAGESNHEAKVVIRLSLVEAIVDLYVGFMIFNQAGNKIIHHKISSDRGIPLSLEAGTYEFESELHTSLFSEGVYRIELDVGCHELKRISNPGVSVTFEVSRPHKLFGEPTGTILTGWKGRFQEIAPLACHASS